MNAFEILVGFQKSELMIMKGPWLWHWVVTWLSVISALCMLSYFSHVLLFVTSWSIANRAPLSMEFSRQEYWSGLPCPSARDLPDTGIKPTSLTSPALQVILYPLNHLGSLISAPQGPIFNHMSPLWSCWEPRHSAIRTSLLIGWPTYLIFLGLSQFLLT